MEHIVPNTPEEVPKDAPTLYREVTDYYRTPLGQHPNSKNWFLLKSVDQIAEYSSYEHVDMISSRTLLMIAGTNADTHCVGDHFSSLSLGLSGSYLKREGIFVNPELLTNGLNYQ